MNSPTIDVIMLVILLDPAPSPQAIHDYIVVRYNSVL